MSDALEAVRSSVERLSDRVRPLDDDEIERPAYPKDWTIADVVSHLGSASVIGRRRLDDALAGRATPDEFSRVVWDEWDAKTPRSKVADGLAAIEAFTAQLEVVPESDRARFHMALGPLDLDWAAFVDMRLNEQLLHEWDVAVALDPAATLAADGTAVVIDNLGLIARFSGRTGGEPRTVSVATTEPDRRFTVRLEPGGVALEPGGGDPDLSLSAEAFIRLVYGRLDPEHTPTSTSGDRHTLDLLRTTFPGA